MMNHGHRIDSILSAELCQKILQTRQRCVGRRDSGERAEERDADGVGVAAGEMRADHMLPARPPFIDDAVRIDEEVVADVAPTVRERVEVPDVADLRLPVREVVRPGGVMDDRVRYDRVHRRPQRRTFAVGTAPVFARTNRNRAEDVTLLVDRAGWWGGWEK